MKQAPQGIRRVRTRTGDPAWLVTGYDDVRRLFSDPRLGKTHRAPELAARVSRVSGLAAPTASVETERADHRRMRRALSHAFSARRMAAIRPRVEEPASRLVDELLASSKPADLHAAFSFPLPALVIAELLGVPGEDRDRFRRWSEDMAHVPDPLRVRDGTAGLRDYLAAAVAAKRAEPAEDVLSDLVADDDVPDEDVVGIATALLIAGHVTTAGAIDKGVILFSRHREVWDALRRDPSLVPGAVEEVLRAPSPTDAGADRAGGRTRYANQAFESLPRRAPALRLAVPAEELRRRNDLLIGKLMEVPVTW